MTKKTIAISLSILVAVMPFLGFPTEIKTYLYVISGLLLAGLIELVSIQSYNREGMFVDRVSEELDKYEDPKDSPFTESVSDDEVQDEGDVEDDDEDEIRVEYVDKK